MSLDEAIKRGLESSLGPSMEKVVDKTIDATMSALWSHPKFPFLAAGQVRLMKAGYKPAEAWEVARTALGEWLSAEKIKFGAPGYSWDCAAGESNVEEYVLADD